MTTKTSPTSRGEYSILEIELVDEVPALCLQCLVSVVNTIYNTSEWVKLASSLPSREPLPDLLFTSLTPPLLIEKLEIGTPNVLRVLGTKEGLTLVLSVLSALGGGLVATSSTFKNYADGRKSLAEARIAEAKLSDELRFQEMAESLKIISANLPLRATISEAQRLETVGVISQEALEHKVSMPKMIAYEWTIAAPIVKPNSIRLK